MESADPAIVITGAGLVTALGRDVASTWSALRSPTSSDEAARATSGWDPFPDDDEKHGTSAGAEAGRREIELLRRAWHEALGSAGLDDGLTLDGSRVAVILGSTLHGMRNGGRFLRTHDFEDLRAFLAGATLARANPMEVPVGLCVTTCSACSSGLASVSLACSLLTLGEADIVIAGGYDPISEYARAGFGSMRLVSPTSVRPFGADREGMRVSEGFGVVVLERAADAEARGRNECVRVVAAGESCDSFHLSKPHPEGEGAASAIGQALNRAGIGADDLCFVVAHGTGTRDNDAAEYAALSRVFGESLSDIPVAGFKGVLGHALGGAGAVEMILAARALVEGVIPLERPGYEVDFANLRLAGGSDWRTRGDHALVTSLGFGGANVSIVLSRCSGTNEERSKGSAPDRVSAVPRVRELSPTESAISFGRQVVVTGIGAILPGAVGRVALASAGGFGEGDEIPTDLTTADYEHLINARRTRRMSEYARLCLAATADALSDVGEDSLSEFLESCPAIVGTAHGATRFCEEFYGMLVKDGTANPLLFAEGVPNIGSAHLSTTFGIRAFCQSIIGARTAGLAALHLAAIRIRAGVWDRAIVCAAEETSPLTNDARRTLSSFGGAAGRANGSNGRASRADRDHRPGRSGAVAFVLQAAEDAIASGRRGRGSIEDGSFSFGGSVAGGVISHIDRVRESLMEADFVSVSGPVRLARVVARRLRCGGGGSGEIDASSACRFGDLYSVAPLVAVAERMLKGSAGRSTTVCVDDDGAAGALGYTVGDGS